MRVRVSARQGVHSWATSSGSNWPGGMAMRAGSGGIWVMGDLAGDGTVGLERRCQRCLSATARRAAATMSLTARPEERQELVVGARRAEAVGDADALHGHGSHRGQGLDDRATQAADDAVLLRGHQRAGLPRGRDDRLAVEGLDGVHLDDARLDALAGQRLRGLQAAADHEPRADQGHVAARPQDQGLADLRGVVVPVDERHLVAVEAHVDRARPGGHLGQQPGHGRGVRWAPRWSCSAASAGWRCP